MNGLDECDYGTKFQGRNRRFFGKQMSVIVGPSFRVEIEDFLANKTKPEEVSRRSAKRGK